MQKNVPKSKNVLPKNIAKRAEIASGRIEPIATYSMDYAFEDFQRTNRIRSLRPATIEFYAVQYRLFMKYVIEYYPDQANDISKWSTLTIENYIEFSLEAGMKNNSVNARLSTIKRFAKFAHERKFTRTYIAQSISNLRTQQKVGRTIPDDDLRKLLHAPNVNTISGIRNYTIIRLLADTGIRVGELTDLTIDDIYLSERHIMLNRTKNRYVRRLPMTQSLYDALEVWISVRQSVDTSLDNLFITLEGRPLTVRFTQYLINDYCDKLGIAKYAPHDFRRRFARTKIMSGVPANVVASLMGHSSIRMLEKYIAIYDSDLDKFIENGSLD